MKRTLAWFLALLFLGTGCTQAGGTLLNRARRDRDLFREAAQEMRAMGLERVYVVLEAAEQTETEAETATAEKRPVRYVKKTDDHKAVDSPVLEQVLRDYGFALILFQTASDGRESVIFSTGEEAETGPVRGVTCSFDGEAVAWWGRAATLTKHKGRYVEINPRGDAWYYTVSLSDGLWYWEKDGSVLG